MSALVPFFRVRDAETSLAWYARLGFELQWTHRFEPGFPLFAAIRRGDSLLFLSEHRGDAPPGSLAYLYADDVDGVAAAFAARAEDTPWGTREVQLTDPDGNRIRVGTSLG